MTFELPKLPYPQDGLAPYISSQTIRHHYGTHTKKYYDTVNDLVSGTIYKKEKTLDDLLNSTSLSIDSKLYKQACQAWNHTFFWDGLCPENDFTPPSGELEEAIKHTYGYFDDFKQEFAKLANELFGSGWIWLVVHEGELYIAITTNHSRPNTKNTIPILCLDVWEHSYYLDYPADRKEYIKQWWNIVDWTIVGNRYEKAIAEWTNNDRQEK